LTDFCGIKAGKGNLTAPSGILKEGDLPLFSGLIGLIKFGFYSFYLKLRVL